MHKLTEEKFREMLNNALFLNTTMAIEKYMDVTEAIIANPEIKSLFEKSTETRCTTKCSKCELTADECNDEAWPTEPPAPVAEYEICKNETSDALYGYYCKQCNRLVCENCLDGDCLECSDCKDVAEYEVIQCEPIEALKTIRCPHNENPCPIMVNSQSCREHCKTNGLQNFAGHQSCREHCKTNGLQNFAGHEVEGKSIRCMHKFNQGAES